MPPSIHGHDVLDLLDDPGKTYTRETFLEAVKAHFGADALYHTCSARSMIAADLLRFLEGRGKFEEVDGHLRRVPAESCED